MSKHPHLASSKMLPKKRKQCFCHLEGRDLPRLAHIPVARTFIVCLTLILTACSSTPTPTSMLNLPTNWLGLSGETLTPTTAPVGNLSWWQSFNDPALTQLIATALENNNSLKVATARVQQARANRLAVTSSFLPEIEGNLNTSRGTTSGNTSTATTLRTTNTANFSANWEVNLLGIPAAARGSQANVEASKAARRNVRISLLAEVVRNYLDLRQLEQQLTLTEKNLNLQAETLRIVTAQYNEGVVSRLDLTRAEAQVATTRAQLPAARQNLNAALNNLAVLAGIQPAQLRQQISPTGIVPLTSPTVVVTTPANVIANRPDVQTAEQNLITTTARKNVALANWFPSLSVTGLFGLTDSGNGTTDIWQAAAGLTVPVIDFGRIRAQVRLADAQQAEALALYEEAILIALADTETALTGYLNTQQRLTEITQAATASREAARLAQLQYQEGAIPLLDVLAAQQQQFTAEAQEAAAKANVGQALANLYTALGGAEAQTP